MFFDDGISRTSSLSNPFGRVPLVARASLSVHPCLRSHMQALIVNAGSAMTLPEAELNAFVDKLFAFSYVWSIAASVDEEG